MIASFTYLPNDRLTIAGFAADNNGSATRSGFDTVFHSPRGTTVGTELELKVKLWGLDGHQRLGVGHSNKDFTELDQRTTIPGGLTPVTNDSDYAIWYNFDQYLYVEKDDHTQGVGIFGRYGYTDGEVNPVQGFYSLGLGGKGICHGRDNDTFGLGYYYIDLSDDLPGMLNVSSEQGLELFYNFEITKSVHITPDLQWIINPGAGFETRDNAVVLGMRLQMSF